MKSLDDIAAAANSTVEQNLHLIADRRGDRGQRPDGARGSIEVVSAMIGH